MRKAYALLLAIYLAPSSAAGAQMLSQPVEDDPRVQTLAYREGQVFAVDGAPGYQLTIELAADERIISAAVGDSGSWQVTANRAGNQLIVKPLDVGNSTNMTVVTTIRRYLFDLRASDMSGATMPYVVKFRYPVDEASANDRPSSGASNLYRVSGDRVLRPERISDDGTQTYIEWAPDTLLPATYVVDDRGRETLANGMMREGVFVIDGVSRRLVFRLDRQSARATRLPSERAR